MTHCLLHTRSDGRTYLNGREVPCAIGKGGITPDKTEGDGCTPAGEWLLTHVYYRPDRLAKPSTALPISGIGPYMGWCDAPQSPFYNQLVTRPFANSHEQLWREDGAYNVLITTFHNTHPTLPGKGSAIFIHLMRLDDQGASLPTEGCLALTQPDLYETLRHATAQSFWRVDAP
jgi:L,D-peptidoglycan transpeptidase YkuD (ErfK/YbiS/YcfS/YnhG family)